jgi:hypothetical protein
MTANAHHIPSHLAGAARIRPLPERVRQVRSEPVRRAPRAAEISNTAAARIAPVSATAVRKLSGSTPASRHAKRNRRAGSIEFRLIFSAAFAFFLLTSLVERALPHKWPVRADGADIRKSVIEQAREAAEISTAYAFMG